MSKKIKAFVKLALNAGKATPAPPVGPALGQHGINIGNFCKEYNARTSEQIGFIIPAKITVYEDKSFSFILKSPTTSNLLMKYANLKKGSSCPNKISVGELSLDHLKEIIEIKKNDLNTQSFKKSLSIILGTAKSLGISIKQE